MRAAGAEDNDEHDAEPKRTLANCAANGFEASFQRPIVRPTGAPHPSPFHRNSLKLDLETIPRTRRIMTGRDLTVPGTHILTFTKQIAS